MRTIHVYHLVDPRDHAVRYVGKTATPHARLRAHIQEARIATNTAKKRWIADLLAAGLQPVLTLVASCRTDVEARLIESRQCHQHLATIYNIHDPVKGARDLRRPASPP